MAGVDLLEVHTLLAQQSGVISRRQVLACGGKDSDIQRMLRRREWARVHEGVYVDHTGPLTTVQQQWAAVLLHWPAALAGASALEAHGLSVDARSSSIELVVARSRRVDDPPGLRTRQVKDFDAVTLMNLSPPRVRVEHAALTVASRASREDRSMAVLADVVQQRRTTARRLLDHVEERPRLACRRFLAEVLGDVAAGTNSALERRFLVDVERAHGLPVGRRQHRVRNGKRTAYRDVDHRDYRTGFELDGRLGHDRASERWADLDRHVEAAVAGDLTVRLGWGQVLQPCRLAISVAAILGARGWAGVPVACGRPDCGLASTGEVSEYPALENLA